MVNDTVNESPLCKSDHSVLIITFKCCTEIANHTRLNYYYDQGDYRGMNTNLDLADWGETLGSNIINYQWLGFKEYIYKIWMTDEFVPHQLLEILIDTQGKYP